MQDPPSLGAPCSQSYRTGTAADTSQLLLVLEPRALLPAPHLRHSQRRFRYRHEPALLCKAPRNTPSTTRWHGCLCLPVLLKRASCPEQNSTKGAKETVSHQHGGQPGRWGYTSSREPSAAEFQLHNSATPHNAKKHLPLLIVLRYPYTLLLQSHTKDVVF